MDMNQILARHLSGTSSPEDEAELLAWLSAEPRRAEQLERLRDAWAMAGASASEASSEHPAKASDRYGDPAEALAGLLERARADDPPVRGTGPAPRPVSPHRRRPAGAHSARLISRRAAGLGALAVLSIAAISILVRGALYGGPEAEVQAFATASGERRSLVLPDGSRILLGPESEIRVPRRFGRGARDLALSGTAFFDVSPDMDMPFRVRAGQSIARVAGTRFVVRAYADDDAVRVAVEEGRVVLAPEAAGSDIAVTLTAGQIGEIDPRGIGRLVPAASLDGLLAWTKGRLVFSDLPLADVARELERWYGVEIRIEEPGLAARRITLSFSAARIDDLLELIALSIGAEVERTGRTVTFSVPPAG